LTVQRFPKRYVGGFRFYGAAKVVAGTASLSVSPGLNRYSRKEISEVERQRFRAPGANVVTLIKFPAGSLISATVNFGDGEAIHLVGGEIGHRHQNTV
jgi:hypothetical protein